MELAFTSVFTKLPEGYTAFVEELAGARATRKDRETRIPSLSSRSTLAAMDRAVQVKGGGFLFGGFFASQDGDHELRDEPPMRLAPGFHERLSITLRS